MATHAGFILATRAPDKIVPKKSQYTLQARESTNGTAVDGKVLLSLSITASTPLLSVLHLFVCLSVCLSVYLSVNPSARRRCPISMKLLVFIVAIFWWCGM